MMIFSLYLPILLSLSISFFLHIFKKHVHSFFLFLATTFKNIINTNTTRNKCHNPIIKHAGGSPPLSIDDGVNNNLMCCNEIGVNDDQIDKNEDEDDDEEEEDEESYWRWKRASDLKQMFPPPISSLNQKGQPNFVLVPTRNNGRLQLQKVRIKRPEILHSSREGGRLKMYLVPNHCRDDVEEEKYEGEEQEQELVQEEAEEEEERNVESEEEERNVESEEEEEESLEEMRNEKEDDDGIVGEWRFPLEDHNNIEGFRRCQHVHGGHHRHHNVHMYGIISIA